MPPPIHEQESGVLDLTADASEPTKSAIEMKSRWPIYEDDEIAVAAEVLRTGRVNALVHGERCGAFESAFAKLCDMPHAIALANGTLALELALRALNIGPGDEVVVTPRSFIASAGCVSICGATPVFADVDPISQNLTAQTVEQVLSPRTRAVIAVHLAGYPCAMDKLVELTSRRGIKLIEDCAQAHGASFKGRPVGSFGDAAAFSFCTDKIISTGGEGGMLLLRSGEVWQRAWSFKDHGKDYNLAKQKSKGPVFRWIHTSIGSNYRLTEMQAAIGLRQLSKLSGWVRERSKRADILLEMLDGLPALRLIRPPDEIGHAYYRFYAFLRPEFLAKGWSRDRVVEASISAGIPCQSGVCPEIYRERAFDGRGVEPAVPLTVAKTLGETSLMLPLDHTLSIEIVRCMGKLLAGIVQSATA